MAIAIAIIIAIIIAIAAAVKAAFKNAEKAMKEFEAELVKSSEAVEASIAENAEEMFDSMLDVFLGRK